MGADHKETKTASNTKATSKTKAKGERSERGERDMGAALRSVYQKTVDEAVPDEFLDLLGKLG